MIELPPLCVLEFSLPLVLTSPLWSRQALAEAERVRTEAEEEEFQELCKRFDRVFAIPNINFS